MPEARCRPLLRIVCGAACVGAGLVGGPAAWACSMVAPELHEVDPDEVAVDTTAPAAPSEAAVVSISRGHGPECDASGVCMSTSCDDIGTLQLTWTPGGDDRTLDRDLGVILRVVEGEAPPGLGPLGEVVLPGAAGEETLVWGDGAEDRQEPLDFVLSIAEVDLAGNESAAVELRVQDPGRRGGSGGSADEDEDGAKGCAVVGGAGGLLLLLPVVGVLTGRRRAR